VYYNKYKKQLEKAGYSVSATGEVTDSAGNSVAGEGAYNQVWCKDIDVDAICSVESIEAIKEILVPKKVRARNAKGHLVGDDPSTPDIDEAWITKLVKKVKGKK
tara:strand:+ start:1296 stop:1607 length:312 start_codon:yes stop_codon:yes gene_type:complete